MDEFQTKLDRYDNALKLAIQSNIQDGDKKTAAAILSVAVTANDNSRNEQASIYGVNESQISTAVR